MFQELTLGYGPFPSDACYQKYILHTYAKRYLKTHSGNTSLFSIILDVDIWDEILIRKTLNSISEQSSPYWELHLRCLPQYYSALENIVEDYRCFHGEKTLITVSCCQEKQEQCTINITKANGDTICFLSIGDTLEVNAVECITSFLEHNPQADIVYSDHDQIDAHDHRHSPVWKPQWSPELLLSHNYIGPSIFYRTAKLTALGLTQEQDLCSFRYDVILHCAECNTIVMHLPALLYHQRDTMKRSTVTSKNILNEALARRGLACKAAIACFAQKELLPFFTLEWNTKLYPPVTIIIPTKDRGDLLKRCMKSLQKTDYPDLSIMIIDNGSTDSSTTSYLKKTSAQVIRIETKTFNYSYLHNIAMKYVETELVLFLNNDTEILDPAWLKEMVNIINMDSRIGAVGAKLLYPTGKVQHAGVMTSHTLGASHVHRHLPENADGYMYSNKTLRNYSAVTAACMLTRKSAFKEVGGFDEKNFPIAYNDVDYCLKLRKHHYRIVFTPFARLLHHEAASRGRNSDHPDDVVRLKKRWIARGSIDPYSYSAFSYILSVLSSLAS